MDELQTILASHHSKAKEKPEIDKVEPEYERPTTSEIPDLFFDQILVQFKLSRVEILVIMYLYRHVWCRPNLYQKYGITQVLSHTELAKNLDLSIDDVHRALKTLEDLSFIETIRSGQYFVRKYFTPDYDTKFGQNYDDF